MSISKTSLNVLFLSNGTGEDRIACTLAEKWRSYRIDDQIQALAMVGSGQFYQIFDIPLILPTLTLPSAGFAYLNPWRLFQDCRAGLLSHLSGQIKLLSSMCSQIDLVISVGDIVPIIGASLIKKPFAFVGCALSDYYLCNGKNTYDQLSKFLLKKHNALVFPRDSLTAIHLLQEGIQIRDVGNPMIDCVDYSQMIIRRSHHSIIALLPGSHQDTLNNLKCMLNCIAQWEQYSFEFWLVLSPQISQKDLRALLSEHHWMYLDSHYQFKQHILQIIQADSFGHVLSQADAAIGTSGTANEQCVAHGIPVLSFNTKGQQYTHAFAQAQQRLLGAALTYIPDYNQSKILYRLLFILHNQSYRQQVKKIGRERFGTKGSSQRVVEEIINYFC